MIEESETTMPSGGILEPFAELLGTKVENNRLVIPEQFGKGYSACFVFNEHIGMMINNHVLNREIAINPPARNLSEQMVFFKFQNVIDSPNAVPAGGKVKELPSVQVSTMGLNPSIVIPGKVNRASIYIVVDANYLRELIPSPDEIPVVQNILRNNQLLLFEQIVSPTLQKIASEIVDETIDRSFELFFYRVKAEELICRLLIELRKREEKKVYPLNIQDIQTVYKVRERMFENLTATSTIEELSLFANMSQSKLKRLFRQIFGDSIFSYYQDFRMKEAARLLKEEKLSVSEVGYRLGFSNLSHFTEVFERHIGMKPKKYSRS
ncbi:MAG: AraC family transcriptional regulator [Tannerella sp.]|jgi:AraC-like DNA-binding protein|nr:AraC family transcriptional regulator [Tannerella sp.]